MAVSRMSSGDFSTSKLTSESLPLPSYLYPSRDINTDTQTGIFFHEDGSRRQKMEFSKYFYQEHLVHSRAKL